MKESALRKLFVSGRVSYEDVISVNAGSLIIVLTGVKKVRMLYYFEDVQVINDVGISAKAVLLSFS